MFRKVITYFLIVAVVLPAIVFPFFQNTVFAVTQDQIDQYYNDYKSAGGTKTKQEFKTENSDYNGVPMIVKKGQTTSEAYSDYKTMGGNKSKSEFIYSADSLDSYSTNTEGSDANTTKTTTTVTDANGNSAEVTTVETDSSSDNGTGSAKKTGEYSNEMKSPCTILSFGTRLCIGYIVSQVLYYVVFSPSYYIALMAGGIFNASIGFSLSGQSFPTDEGSMIATGWKMVRDLLNLFFIFILLYVAIATIIQYGSFGKDAIVKIIIAAVLINFSLMMTKMVIDSSHILAWGFYDKIEERQVTDKDGNKTVAPIIPEEITVKGIKTKNLAGVFMAGFNPQRLNIPSSTTKDSVSKGASAAMADGSGILGVIWQAVLIMILASALNFVVAFILFAGAIMFIIRVVVLWFVLLFSPLAFAGLIMPSFKKYSSMWWDALIKQAFFAPAFLFLFYLVTMMVNSGFLDAVIKGYKNAPSAAILFFDPGSTIVVFFHFFVIGSLLVGCLYLAQQMGAHGAGAMMKFGNKTGDWARNKFGDKAAWRGTKYGLRYGGGVAGDSNWWKQSIGRIPGGNILGRKLGAMKKADEDKARKAAEKYAGTLSSAGRKSLAGDIEDKGFVKRFMYAGPEGAFKPGKEGYEKIIAKKTEEEKEKKLYYESWAELYNKTKLDLTEKHVSAKDMEERIKKGELGIMEEETEKRRKDFNEKREQEKEDNNLEITKKNREIRRLETELAEQRKKGENGAARLTENVIDDLDKEISTLNKFNNEITVIDKTLDRHEKKVESYRSRELSKSKPTEEKKPEKKKD